MQFIEYLNRQDELEQKLTDNPTSYQEYGKEYAFLNKICPLIKQYHTALQNIDDLEGLLKTEKEMYDELIIEIKSNKRDAEQYEHAIRQLLVSKDSDDESNAIIEIRPGTGGVESCLFVSDIMRMYIRYAALKGWIVEETNINMAEQGVKEVCLLIKGDQVYKALKYESGVHRVQRVPETEAAGRIHTSAVTVAVLPEEKAIQIKIDDRDLEIDVYRSGGKGGQSVNTTDSAVRITHKPTGIVVAMQDERSQLQNKQKAMQVLKVRLYQKQLEDEENARAKDRKEQVGSGDRSEKIRTYNYPQNRVTDHRLSKSWHNLPEVMNGNLLGEIIEDLGVYMEQQKLLKAS